MGLVFVRLIPRCGADVFDLLIAPGNWLRRPVPDLGDTSRNVVPNDAILDCMVKEFNEQAATLVSGAQQPAIWPDDVL